MDPSGTNMQGEAWNREIRHLSHTDKLHLAAILNSNDNWKRLFDIIPKNLADIGRENGTIDRKYETGLIRMIEEEARRQQSCPVMILFDEWGSSGKSNNRPTIRHLYDLLTQVPVYRAVDYIAKEMFGMDQPERPPRGPAQRINISLPVPDYDTDQMVGMLERLDNPSTAAMQLRGPTTTERNEDNPRYDIQYEKAIEFPETSSTVTSRPTEETNTMSNDTKNSDGASSSDAHETDLNDNFLSETISGSNEIPKPILLGSQLNSSTLSERDSDLPVSGNVAEVINSTNSPSTFWNHDLDPVDSENIPRVINDSSFSITSSLVGSSESNLNLPDSDILRPS